MMNSLEKRLKRGKWFVEIKCLDQLKKFLNYCEYIDIKWISGKEATKFFYNSCDFPLIIEIENNKDISLTFCDVNSPFYTERKDMEDLTDWFFNECPTIKNFACENKWQSEALTKLFDIFKNSSFFEQEKIYEKVFEIENIYNLPITLEMWNLISKHYHYAAMDESGDVYLFHSIPMLKNNQWIPTSDNEDEMTLCCLEIDTSKIDWKRSLSRRLKAPV